MERLQVLNAPRSPSCALSALWRKLRKLQMEGGWEWWGPWSQGVPVTSTHQTKGQVRVRLTFPNLGNLSSQQVAELLPEPHSPLTTHTGKLRPKDRLKQSSGHQDQAGPLHPVLPT